MVHGDLEYAISVWNPHLKKHINALEGVQRRATKLVPALKHMDYETRLRSLSLPSLAYRRHRGDMIETFKILNIYDKNVSQNLLSKRQNSITRGNNMKLYQQSSKVNTRKFSFGLRIVKYWNSLPNCVIQAPSINSFENRLDKFWQHQNIRFDYSASITIDNSNLEMATINETADLDI